MPAEAAEVALIQWLHMVCNFWIIKSLMTVSTQAYFGNNPRPVLSVFGRTTLQTTASDKKKLTWL